MYVFNFTRQSPLFSKDFVPIYTTIISVSEFLLLFILANIWCYPTKLSPLPPSIVG